MIHTILFYYISTNEGNCLICADCTTLQPTTLPYISLWCHYAHMYLLLNCLQPKLIIISQKAVFVLAVVGT
jgi:hypothetical protein